MTQIAHGDPVYPTITDQRMLSLHALIARHRKKSERALKMSQQQQSQRHESIIERLSRRLAGEPKPARRGRRAPISLCNES